jgi:small subunit ribosomal protein S16
MLMIRLQRVGRKHEPTFRVVLTDSKNGPRSGKFLEILGSYDARDKNVTKINADRIKYWMSVGAKVSDTVHNFLVSQKVIDAKKINVLPKKAPIIKEAPVAELAKEENVPAVKESTDESVVSEESTPVEETETTVVEEATVQVETPAAEEATASEESSVQEPTKE